MRLPKIVLLLGLLAWAAGAGTAGEEVSNPQLGMRVTIPDGFVPAPDLVQGDVIHAFRKTATGKQKCAVEITFERLGEVLGREKLDPDQEPALRPPITISTEKWKEFDIYVFRVPQQFGGIDTITLNAQVPLRAEAVQVSVAGEADREEELRELLRTVLAKLEGETNWLTAREREERLRNVGWAMLGGYVFMPIVVCVVLWLLLRPKAKPKRRRD